MCDLKKLSFNNAKKVPASETFWEMVSIIPKNEFLFL